MSGHRAGWAALVLLAGCIPPPRAAPPSVYRVQAPFVEAEHAQYRGAGSSRIVGQVFARTVGGEARKGVGATVMLLPRTSYFDEWYRYATEGWYERVEIENREAAALVRSTTCDGDGNFEIGGLPAGTYYVASMVTWKTPSADRYCGDYPGSRNPCLVQQGGLVTAIVTVSPGQTVRANVTR